MTDFIVRMAKPEDQAFIAEMDSEFPTTRDRSEPPRDTDVFRLALEHSRELRLFYVVAEREGVPLGYGLIGPRQSPMGIDRASISCVLANLAVTPSARRLGVGAAILVELERLSRSLGIRFLYAHIPGSAADFYRASGWTVADEGRGLAWIEPPTIQLWQEQQQAIGNAGPRRAMTILRADYPDVDLGYGRMAYRSLRPDAVVDVFSFPRVGDNSILGASEFLARECDRDPSIFAALPADVSRQLVEVFMPSILGPSRTAEIRRLRR